VSDATPAGGAEGDRAHTAAALADVVAGLDRAGFAVVGDFLPSAAIAALRTEASRRDAAALFTPAGVGRGAARAERTDIRGDRIVWLDEMHAAGAERPLFAALDALRLAVNAALYLGLFEFEGHYALYPPGADYARHRDRFRDDDARVVSCVLYLNDGWRVADGGALRLHLDRGVYRDVLPVGGTLACFLAERFEHEVLPATRERLALSGWFRRRKLESDSTFPQLS